jgi:hypothetical protein
VRQSRSVCVVLQDRQSYIAGKGGVCTAYNAIQADCRISYSWAVNRKSKIGLSMSDCPLNFHLYDHVYAHPVFGRARSGTCSPQSHQLHLRLAFSA